MKRRLYFLLPDVEHTRAVIHDLQKTGVTSDQVHVLAGTGIDLQDLPRANGRQQRGFGERLETLLWDGNLAVFFTALAALLPMAWLQLAWYWLMLPAAVMLVTFVLGEEFTRRIPNVHVSQFRDALQHEEILLMVDVPANQVAAVEGLVPRHHPEAVAGGVGWQVDALHA
jgi:hypothetical protein